MNLENILNTILSFSVQIKELHSICQLPVGILGSGDAFYFSDQETFGKASLCAIRKWYVRFKRTEQ